MLCGCADYYVHQEWGATGQRSAAAAAAAIAPGVTELSDEQGKKE